MRLLHFETLSHLLTLKVYGQNHTSSVPEHQSTDATHIPPGASLQSFHVYSPHILFLPTRGTRKENGDKKGERKHAFREMRGPCRSCAVGGGDITC